MYEEGYIWYIPKLPNVFMPFKRDAQAHGVKHARRRLVARIVGETFAVGPVVRPAFGPQFIGIEFETCTFERNILRLIKNL